MKSKAIKPNQSLTFPRTDTKPDSSLADVAKLLRLFEAGKTMPDWSRYHVKTDGRAYFRFYIPEDLKGIIGPFPMVNLRMKASRQAERLALMHYIAFEGVIEEAR
nr:hypothetical protein [uncultured Rhodoferax sp.]